MLKFKIIFSNPWFFLFLIPAAAVALVPYFLSSKKYRRTRNRIMSLVLYAFVILLSVSVLSGITFAYEEPITTNEVLLLVDVSHSTKESETNMKAYVKNILDASDSGFQIGIITFGKDCNYVAPFNNDTKKVYQEYLASLDAKRTDDRATDIAGALLFAQSLFSNPSAGRIILLSDGIETDGDAINTIKLISRGIRIDAVSFSNDINDEIQLIDIILPDYNITVNEPVKIGVTVQSSYEASATITLYVNGEESRSKTVDLLEDIETFELEHTFLDRGLQEIRFEIKCNDAKDKLVQNNTYFTYFYLDVYDNILIVDGGNESTLLELLISEEFNVEVVNVNSVPDTLSALREYDQVILMNVAGEDIPDGFISLLNSYVYDCGGGLLTVGGDKAYKRADMLKYPVLQKMLPVEAVNYTPPLGLMIVIDCSGSMDSSSGIRGKNRLDLAKEGAMACLSALSYRDWVGVISFSDKHKVEVPLTPVPNRLIIEEAIQGIELGGGTLYFPAIEVAGRELMALSEVQKKHIMFITDGAPGDPREDYEKLIELYNSHGITFSAISIASSEGASKDVIDTMAALGGGKPYMIDDVRDLGEIMYTDLKMPSIIEVVQEPFTPIVRSPGAQEMRGINTTDSIPQLGGFYGTRLKRDAEVILGAEFVPLYAKWKYGKGRVGSFMCDLNGTWSGEFLVDLIGSLLVKNIIKGLFPTESIRPKEIDIKLEVDNYTVQISAFSNIAIADRERVKATITAPPRKTDGIADVQNVVLDVSNRGFFVFSDPGVYSILIQRQDINGNNIGNSETFYTVFSYSDEYDVFVSLEDAEMFLEALVQAGGGEIISDTMGIFENITLTIDKTFDPRLIFITIALILLLLDIAARKFKWKWPWEIIRDQKIKKAFVARKE